MILVRFGCNRRVCQWVVGMWVVGGGGGTDLEVVVYLVVEVLEEYEYLCEW